jgi:hypothetical protein
MLNNKKKTICINILFILSISLIFSCKNKDHDLQEIDLSHVLDEQLYYMYNKILLPYPSPANETDNKLPLPKYGIMGLEGLNKTMSKIKTSSIKNHFEKGYRYLFTNKPFARDLKKAKIHFQTILEIDKQNCHGYYGLALTNLLTPSKHRKFLKRALGLFLKTVEINPDHGDAHYMLAVIFSFFDKPKSFFHYQKSIALGVKDEKKIGEANFDDIYYNN